jgi:uncharacterized protein
VYRRHAEPRIREALTDTRVVAISGPRQSGKTTLARAIAGTDYTYVTLDDPAILSAARNDPTGLIARLDRAVIDEIQRAPELVLSIKKSVDEDPRPGRFLITGSADLLAMPKAAESLAGRIEVVPLLPLSLCERTDAHPTAFLDSIMRGAPPEAQAPSISLVETVLAGGYPEALTRTIERRRQEWHRAYIRSILDRDLRDMSSIDRLDRVPELFGLLATRSGQLVNWLSLGSQVRLDGKTVERYVRLLEQLYLIRRVPAWSGNPTQRLISTPKLHFMDSGLLSSSLGLTQAKLVIDRSPLGATLETFVFSELMKALPLMDESLRLSHYRDKDKVEVDFVLENAQGTTAAVEVKASSTVTATDFRGLRRLSERIGERFTCGVVLYDGVNILPFGNKLFAVPISSIWANGV